MVKVWRRTRSAGRTPDARGRYARYRRAVRAGQLVMVVAVVMVAVHMLTHFGAFGAQPSGWQDLLVGYPMAAMLFLGGAILAGRIAPK